MSLCDKTIVTLSFPTVTDTTSPVSSSHLVTSACKGIGVFDLGLTLEAAKLRDVLADVVFDIVEQLQISDNQGAVTKGCTNQFFVRSSLPLRLHEKLISTRSPSIVRSASFTLRLHEKLISTTSWTIIPLYLTGYYNISLTMFGRFFCATAGFVAGSATTYYVQPMIPHDCGQQITDRVKSVGRYPGPLPDRLQGRVPTSPPSNDIPDINPVSVALPAEQSETSTA
jgi:hypothetical protein